MGVRDMITKYPDEPHPDNEFEWKAWWVRKCFKLDQPLTARAIQWIHDCWNTTKAGWYPEKRPKNHGTKKALAKTGENPLP